MNTIKVKKKSELSEEDMRAIVSHLLSSLRLMRRFPLKRVHRADREGFKQTYLDVIEALGKQIKEAEER